MQLANTTELLLRNPALLEASNVLLINAPADSFIHQYKALYSNIELSSFNVHYGEYCALKKSFGESLDCQFSHVYQSEKQHDLVIIHFPKSKQELPYYLAMLEGKLTKEARILIVGDNKGGVKSVKKLLGDSVVYCTKHDAARHCSLFQTRLKPQATFNLSDWYREFSFSIASTEVTVTALPGVFSQDRLDKGTELLLNNLPDSIKGKALDFGCGAGVIGTFIAKHFGLEEIEMYDVNALAIASSKQTLAINGVSAAVNATDSLSDISGHYDCIFSNPPFHQGIKTHYQATETFLAGIANLLKPKGTMTIVANSFLKYPPIIEQALGKCDTIAKGSGFSIYQAHK